MSVRRESQSPHPVIKNTCWIMGYGYLQRVCTPVGKFHIAEALAETVAKTSDTNQAPGQQYLGDVILDSPDAVAAENRKPSIRIRKSLVVAKDCHMRKISETPKMCGYACPQLREVRDAAWCGDVIAQKQNQVGLSQFDPIDETREFLQSTLSGMDIPNDGNFQTIKSLPYGFHHLRQRQAHEIYSRTSFFNGRKCDEGSADD